MRAPTTTGWSRCQLEFWRFANGAGRAATKSRPGPRRLENASLKARGHRHTEFFTFHQAGLIEFAGDQNRFLHFPDGQTCDDSADARQCSGTIVARSNEQRIRPAADLVEAWIVNTIEKILQVYEFPFLPPYTIALSLPCMRGFDTQTAPVQKM